MPKVSIGMPIYNGENYLRPAIASLLAQTFTDFELILCDNASTDTTESICRSFAAANPRIRYHRNEKNIGAMPNFQLALTLSNAPYFKWAAHDDIYEAGWLERCVATLDAGPDVLVAYTRTILIDSESREIERFRDPFRLDSPSPSQRFREIVVKLQWCHAVFGLMRRERLIALPPMGSFIGSDTIYLAELALHGRFLEDEQYLFRRRLHAASSQRANTTTEDLQAWFNPAVRGKPFFRHWRYLREYSAAIRRAHLGPWEQARCFIFLLRFANWRRLQLWRETRAVVKKTMVEKISTRKIKAEVRT